MTTEWNLKQWMVERTLAEVRGLGLQVVTAQSNLNTPWGAYIRIAEDSLAEFIGFYFAGIETPTPSAALRLDPKILLVAPDARLSLQYHHRRQEHWRVMDGPIGVVAGTGHDDLVQRDYASGEVIRLACGEWHRLVGLGGWGRVAEIWHHTDAANPSDENDIVRVQDDFGR